MIYKIKGFTRKGDSISAEARSFQRIVEIIQSYQEFSDYRFEIEEV